MLRTSKRALSFLLPLLALSLSCSAADPKQSAPDPATQTLANKSLDDLQRDRNAIESDIETLRANIDDLSKQQYWVNAKVTADQELKAAQSRNAQESELAPLRKAARDAAKDVNTTLTLADITKNIETMRSQLEDKKTRKSAIETQISQMVNLEKPKQEFKKDISFYCAILIGLVIFGFFWVAYRDEVVRREIFAGQAGIQFITLFSLVIAIILFGITGVLEGKELSALLGGLSGYILGRSSTTKSSAAPDPPQQNPPPPVKP